MVKFFVKRHEDVVNLLQGSPTKEHPSPAKEKKKKKKFRMPSFTKTKKSKDSKESTI